MDKRTRAHRRARPPTTWRQRSRIWGGLIIVAGTVVALAYAAMALGLAGSSPAPSEFIQRAPPSVQEAYAYALAHPEVLRQIPCFCGCINTGHASNLDCFIDQRLPDGGVVYDLMGST